MDVILIFVGILVIIISVSLIFERDVSKEVISALILGILGILMIGWAITAMNIRSPNITYVTVRNVEIDGNNFQLIKYNNKLINITEKTGIIYTDGQRIRIKDYTRVWSIGVYCITGEIRYETVLDDNSL